MGRAFLRTAFILLFLSCFSTADINLAPLPQRPVSTLSGALAKAKKDTKAVFLILFDDRETIANTLNFFFDAADVKKAFDEHFVICVRDRRRPDVVAYDLPGHAWNRARYVVLAPSGEQIHEGRFLRNDEAGMQETELAVRKWLEVKPRFEGKPGTLPPRQGAQGRSSLLVPPR